ncbi:unnamed protein product, partial [Amoebophrya sp. A25]|eukprot:GSA25T00027923001.1
MIFLLFLSLPVFLPHHPSPGQTHQNQANQQQNHLRRAVLILRTPRRHQARAPFQVNTAFCIVAPPKDIQKLHVGAGGKLR